MSKTWLVFESGRAYSLNCTTYVVPKGHPRPVDAYVVTEPDGDFTVAARRAVESVYSCAVKRGFAVHPVIAGFDLLERNNQDVQISGESAGLAFAVAFAKCLLNPCLTKSDLEELNSKSLAATGVISSEGKIKRVNGIDKKLKSVANILPDNSWIFFPQENQKDITPELEKIFKAKNHKVSAVSDIDMVMDLLFGNKNSIIKKSVSKIILAVLLILLFAVFAGGYYIKKNPDNYKIFEIFKKDKVLQNSEKEKVIGNQKKLLKIKPKDADKKKADIADKERMLENTVDVKAQTDNKVEKKKQLVKVSIDSKENRNDNKKNETKKIVKLEKVTPNKENLNKGGLSKENLIKKPLDKINLNKEKIDEINPKIGFE